MWFILSGGHKLVKCWKWVFCEDCESGVYGALKGCLPPSRRPLVVTTVAAMLFCCLIWLLLLAPPPERPWRAGGTDSQWLPSKPRWLFALLPEPAVPSRVGGMWRSVEGWGERVRTSFKECCEGKSIFSIVRSRMELSPGSSVRWLCHVQVRSPVTGPSVLQGRRADRGVQPALLSLTQLFLNHVRRQLCNVHSFPLCCKGFATWGKALGIVVEFIVYLHIFLSQRDRNSKLLMFFWWQMTVFCYL